MPLTHGKAKEAFDHVVMFILKLLRKSHSKRPCRSQGIGNNDIKSMVSISDTDIDSLTYDKSEMEKDVFLSRRDKSLIHIFHYYIIHCNSDGDPIGDPWLSSTSNDFDSYQVSPDYIATKYV